MLKLTLSEIYSIMVSFDMYDESSWAMAASLQGLIDDILGGGGNV